MIMPYLRGPLYHSLRHWTIREGELEYLLGRHRRHAEVRRHVKIARAVMAPAATREGRPIDGLIGLAFILGLGWLLALALL